MWYNTNIMKMNPKFSKILPALILSVLLFATGKPAAILAVDSGFTGEYFNNPDLSGTPALIRSDPAINFDWAHGSPDPAINADLFSVRWTGSDNFQEGTYRFITTTDDGVRFYIDNDLIQDDWVERGDDIIVDKIMTAGTHNIKMEFYERYGAAVAILTYQLIVTPTPVPTPTSTPVPTPTPTPDPTPAQTGNVGIGVTATSSGQTTASELPKTGLPVLAWVAIAFVPFGVKLIRFSNVKGELEDSPNYAWEKRQFKADLDRR